MRQKIAIILISAVTALTGVAPANAFPTVSAPAVQSSQQVETVQWREGRRDWRRYSPRYSQRYYRDDRRWRGDRRYYSDRRWRHHRHHRGSNAGAIIGGLAAGAIIGGALAAPRYAPAPRRYAGSNSHVNWCYARYRSYRAYDNTFQPYNGPRQQCYSPY
jgi:hypothetical protein